MTKEKKLEKLRSNLEDNLSLFKFICDEKLLMDQCIVDIYSGKIFYTCEDLKASHMKYFDTKSKEYMAQLNEIGEKIQRLKVRIATVNTCP